MYEIRKQDSLYEISHKMCSMNSLASAKKVCRNSRKPIKNLAGFSYRLAWHKRTNCLSLKLHRKNFARVTCWILFDKLPLKGECQKIQWKMKDLNWNLFGDGSWSTLKLLYRPKCSWKAKPEHFQSKFKRSHSVHCAPEFNCLFPWKKAANAL